MSLMRLCESVILFVSARRADRTITLMEPFHWVHRPVRKTWPKWRYALTLICPQHEREEICPPLRFLETVRLRIRSKVLLVPSTWPSPQG